MGKLAVFEQPSLFEGLGSTPFVPGTVEGVQEIMDGSCRIHVARHPRALAEMVGDRLQPWLFLQDAVALDTETICQDVRVLRGLKVAKNKVRGPHPAGDIPRLLQIGNTDTVFVIDLAACEVVDLEVDSHGVITGRINQHGAIVLSKCLSLLASKTTVVAHNAAYDLGLAAKWFGLRPSKAFCTMLGAQVLARGQGWAQGIGFSLLELAKTVGYNLDKGLQRSDWSAATLTDAQILYAAADIPPLLPIMLKQLEAFKERRITSIARLEMETLGGLIDIEVKGIPVSVKAIAEYNHRVNAKREEAEQEVRTILGMDKSEVVSGSSIGRACDRLNIRIGKTATGQADTSREYLQELVGHSNHPVVDALIRLSDYKASHQGQSLLENIEAIGWQTGMVHPRLKQLGTDTGRMSMGSPNMTAMAKYGALGIRSVVEAPDGYQLIKADYGQIELRIAAEFAPDPVMIKVFKEDRDLHLNTAASLFNKPESQISKDDRQLGKTSNFGLICGTGANTLVRIAKTDYGVNLDIEEAKRIKKIFFQTYPGIQKWHRGVAEMVRKMQHAGQPYVVARTIGGRERVIPLSGENMAFCQYLSTPVQGTAADGIKAAVALIHKPLRVIGGRIINVVHDEILVLVPENQAEEGAKIVKEGMKTGMELFIKVVPVVIDLTIQKVWS